MTFTALSLTVLVTQNLGFLLLHRPHKDSIQLLAELSNEVCLSVVCVCITSYCFTEAASWLETVCVGIVYLSLALGNVAAVAGSIKVALVVIRKYKALRKVKPKSILGANRRFNQFWTYWH